MKRWTLDELRELAPGYVMDILDPEERTAFETALSSSPELAADVAEHRAVAHALASEQSVAPPPALRDSLLLRIAAERTRSVQPLERTRARRPASWMPAALGLALAASLVFAFVQQRQNHALAARLREQDSAIHALSARLEARDDQLNTLLDAERDLLIVNLASADLEKLAQKPGIQLFWNVKSGRGMLHAFRLPPASPGHVYQLWLIRDGKPVASEVFNSAKDGHGLFAGFELPREVSGVTALSVTEEPSGGSHQPTTSPFLIGTVPRTE